MYADHRPPSLENRPLLGQRPTSYGGTNGANPEVPNIEPLQAVSNSRNDLWWILSALMAGVMLLAFDGTVMATLLTPIGSEFNASHRASYLGSSYMLSSCCFALIFGRLADTLGRKGSMLLGLSLFSLGTMWCGMARSMNLLIAGRVVAGMGGGAMPTVTNIMLSDLVPLRKRGLYQGFINIAYGLGATLGGPIGGWANDNLGWRWAFYIQAPILLFSFVVIAVKVNIPLSDEAQRRTLSDKLRRIDYLGSITLAGALCCFFLAVDFCATDVMPWTHPWVICLFVSSAFFGCSFIMTEQSWAPYPVLPLRLIFQRQPLALLLSNLLLSMSVFSMLYSAPIFYSTVRSHPSAIAGLYLLPHSIFVPTGSLFAGWYMMKVGKMYSLTIHAALLVLLSSVLAILWSKRSSEYHLWLDLLPQAFGFSSVITTTMIAMIASVRTEDVPIIIGSFYVFRLIGQSAGVTLGGVVLQSVLLQRLRAKIHGPGSEELIYSIRRSTQIIPSLEPHIRHTAIEAYADALRVVFICQAAIGLLGLLPCLLIKENLQSVERDRGSHEGGE